MSFNALGAGDAARGMVMGCHLRDAVARFNALGAGDAARGVRNPWLREPSTRCFNALGAGDAARGLAVRGRDVLGQEPLLVCFNALGAGDAARGRPFCFNALGAGDAARGRPFPARKKVLDDVVATMTESGCYRGTFAEDVLQKGIGEYLRLTRLALQAATWVKRYVEALHKEAPEQPKL